MPEGVDEVIGGGGVATLNPDEQKLAEMGYKQELNRSWSGFSNFAISFSIISILAGCFTTFYSGWNGGGPAAIAWGWPILACLILCIGLCLSELVSAYPTSGGIYWWASKLGGVKAGYYTGWLNLIGLLAIVASVAYGCATFFDLTLGFFFTSWHSGSLHTIFLFFLGILVIAVPGQHLLEPPALHLQQHLGVVARVRCAGHRPHPDLPAAPPRQRVVRLHLAGQQHRASSAARRAGSGSSSSSCPSGPC